MVRMENKTINQRIEFLESYFEKQQKLSYWNTKLFDKFSEMFDNHRERFNLHRERFNLHFQVILINFILIILLGLGIMWRLYL